MITSPSAATLAWHRCAAPSLAWNSWRSYDISVCVLIFSLAVFMDGTWTGCVWNSVFSPWRKTKKTGKGQDRRPWQRSVVLEEAALRCARCVLAVKTLYTCFQMVIAFWSSCCAWVRRRMNMVSYGTSLGESKYGGDRILYWSEMRRTFSNRKLLFPNRKIPVNDGDAPKSRLELREENHLNHSVVRS